eukprot:scaffold8665_cov32-Phaeocystis_antarctica.AAC.1
MASASRLGGRAEQRQRGREGKRAEAPRVELQRACTAGERHCEAGDVSPAWREVSARPRRGAAGAMGESYAAARRTGAG